MMKCKNCGQAVQRRMAEKEKWNSKFCSWKCYLDYRKRHGWVSLECATCGNKFERPLNQVKRNKNNYCSANCYLRRNEKDNIVKCDTCGKNIRRMPSRRDEFDRHFCSWECSGEWHSNNLSGENAPNWHGGTSFELYPIEFNNNLKRQIKKRDNYTCQLCGDQILKKGTRNKHLVVHHINYRKDDCTLSNLVTLCNFCHTSVNFQREDWTAYFQGKLAGVEYQPQQLVFDFMETK